MPCLESRYESPTYKKAKERKQKAINMLTWLSLEQRNPDLLKVSGNKNITEETERMRSSGNSYTHADFEERFANFEESKLCEAINKIGIKKFETFINEHPSHVATDLSTWWKRHKKIDTAAKAAEKKEKLSKIKHLEDEIKKLKATL